MADELSVSRRRSGITTPSVEVGATPGNSLQQGSSYTSVPALIGGALVVFG